MTSWWHPITKIKEWLHGEADDIKESLGLPVGTPIKDVIKTEINKVKDSIGLGSGSGASGKGGGLFSGLFGGGKDANGQESSGSGLSGMFGKIKNFFSGDGIGGFLGGILKFLMMIIMAPIMLGKGLIDAVTGHHDPAPTKDTQAPSGPNHNYMNTVPIAPPAPVKTTALPQEVQQDLFTGTPGVRINNPGYLAKTTSGSPMPGEIQGSDRSYATFRTAEAGLAAFDRNLMDYQTKDGFKTLISTTSDPKNFGGIIGAYASSDYENKTPEFAQSVAKSMSAELGRTIDPYKTELDLKDPAVMAALSRGATEYSHGKSVPYTREAYTHGANMALGLSPTDSDVALPKQATAALKVTTQNAQSTANYTPTKIPLTAPAIGHT